MATPLSHAARVAAMRAEGLRVVVLPGAESNNRNHKGAWGPVNGLLVHHTGSNTNDPAGYARFLFGGRSDLPGPLCHDGLAPDGTIYVVGNGRANHAGKGSSATLDRIIAETLPLDAEVRPGPDNVDGNARLYGLEIMYSGSRAMTPEQREASVKWAAAHCRAHAWSAGSVAGHKEWTASKWDPGQCHMGQLRKDVAARLSTATTAGGQTNVSSSNQEDDGMSAWDDTDSAELTNMRKGLEAITNFTYEIKVNVEKVAAAIERVASALEGSKGA